MTTSLPTTQGDSPRLGNDVHVLTLTPFYPVQGDDGQGCFVAEPLPWVEKLGVRNTVLAVRPFYRGHVQTSDSAIPARWIRFFTLPGGLGLPFSGAFLFSSILAQVRKLHRTNPVQVIHAHSALPCGHAAALLSRELGIPFVVTVHGLDAFSTNQVGGYAGRWCERVSRMVYRSARKVICVSEKVRDQVERAAPVNTVVVYNSADPEMFAPSEDVAEPRILSIGNLIPTKGHDTLLRAFAPLSHIHHTLSCEIIGDGPEGPRLKALATELNIAGKVHFLGRQSRRQVAEAMRRCTVFALPSRYEGLGCVYLEAMSAGKPAVACHGQGIDEIIQHGFNGWLVHADDIPALTDGLSQLLQNPELRHNIGDAARRTILQGFTPAYQAARLYRIYAECLT